MRGLVGGGRLALLGASHGIWASKRVSVSETINWAASALKGEDDLFVCQYGYSKSRL